MVGDGTAVGHGGRAGEGKIESHPQKAINLRRLDNLDANMTVVPLLTHPFQCIPLIEHDITKEKARIPRNEKRMKETEVSSVFPRLLRGKLAW